MKKANIWIDTSQTGILDTEMTLDTGIFSGTPDSVGIKRVLMRAENEYGATSEYVTLNQVSPYKPELFDTGISTYCTDEQSVRINSSHVDPDPDHIIREVSWQVSNLPGGLSFDTLTGRITGKVYTAGDYASLISVTTNCGSASGKINWHVERARPPVPVYVSSVYLGKTGIGSGSTALYLDKVAPGGSLTTNPSYMIVKPYKMGWDWYRRMVVGQNCRIYLEAVSTPSLPSYALGSISVPPQLLISWGNQPVKFSARYYGEDYSWPVRYVGFKVKQVSTSSKLGLIPKTKKDVGRTVQHTLRQSYNICAAYDDVIVKVPISFDYTYYAAY